MPSFKYNLVSITSLTMHLKCIVSFTDFFCLLQAPSLKRPLEIGKAHDGLYGLYFLCKDCLQKSTQTVNKGHSLSTCVSSGTKSFPNSCLSSTTVDIVTCHCNSHSCSPYVNTSFHKNNIGAASVHVVLPHKSDVDQLWHNRLGHVPFSKMRQIPSIPVKFSLNQSFFCPVCPMARQTRLPFPTRTKDTTTIFDLLHIDLWGPYHVATHDKHKYFLPLLDDHSRCTWTQLLSCKSNMIHTIIAFVSMIENQFKTNLKAVRTDNGLEFTNTILNNFFVSKGILHQKSCPYTPQQNGVVERKYKYLLETARAFFFNPNYL